MNKQYNSALEINLICVIRYLPLFISILHVYLFVNTKEWAFELEVNFTHNKSGQMWHKPKFLV